MHFETFADFIEMGGYGFFVWLAFGVSFFGACTGLHREHCCQTQTVYFRAAGIRAKTTN